MSKKSPSAVDKLIGTRIRLRRNLIGMSQEKLADRLGLTFQQVQKYEKGANRIGAGRLQEVADILQVPVPFFFEGHETQSTPSASPLDAFWASKEGIELAQAFRQIESPEMRRAIIDLAKAARSPK